MLPLQKQNPTGSHAGEQSQPDDELLNKCTVMVLYKLTRCLISAGRWRVGLRWTALGNIAFCRRKACDDVSCGNG